MHIETEVLRKGPARHDMCGQFKGYPLSLTDGKISKKLSSHLVRYATGRVNDAGLMPQVIEKVTVGTADEEDKVADRAYWVTFRTPQGGELTVQGILLYANQTVNVDHGLSVETY